MKFSKFRLLQNQVLRHFALDCLGKDVVELGGTYSENNREHFVGSKSFIITNLYDINCDSVEDVTNLSFQSDSVERIVCVSVLQHVLDFNKAISEIVRVLKPGGKALITNGFLFPVCMEEDYIRLTPRYWERRLENEPVKFEIIKLGNRYSAVENLLMRPYGKIGGVRGFLNKFLGQVFAVLGRVFQSEDSYPIGVAVWVEKTY